MNYGEHPTSAPDGDPHQRLQELLAAAEPLDTSQGDVQHYASPEFYIKSTSLDNWEDGQPVETQTIAYQNLAALGVPVVPFELYTDENNFYVVASRIEGVPAGDLLATSPDLSTRYDQITAKTITGIGQLRSTSEYFPADAFGSGQYMVGKLAGQETGPELFFVDIEVTTGGFVMDGNQLEDEARYTDLLGDAAWSIIDDEQQHGIRLEQARTALLNQVNELTGTAQDVQFVQSRCDAIIVALATNNIRLLDFN